MQESRASDSCVASVLVADDSRLTTQLMEAVLLGEGYRIVTVRTGRQALALLRERQFSLAVLGVKLPGLGGFEVAEKLRASPDGAFLPILFLSGDSESHTRVRSLQYGVTGFLTKPFAVPEFTAQVKSLLALKAMHDSLQHRARVLEELSRRDSLTGLYNHGYFCDLVAHECRRTLRYGEDLSCLFIDIDDFKAVNDGHGHLVGDAVIRGVARVIGTCIRDVDVVGRYGGEEFGVLLPCTSVNQAIVVAERIRKGIEGWSLATKHGTLRITVSIGAADLGKGRLQTADQLLEQADRMVYAAKAQGKNRVVCVGYDRAA